MRDFEAGAEEIQLDVGRQVLSCPALVAFQVFPENGVNRGLVALAMVTKECQNIWVETQGDLLLLPGPANCLREKIRTKFGHVGKIDP